MKHRPVPSLNVFYAGAPIGKLALRDRRVWFQYDPAFLVRGIELSPLKLPLRPEVVSCDDHALDGLFGLFNDSLPDGWGRLLLDRHMRSLGIAPETLTVLDRLACVGRRGMGALTYEPESNTFSFDAFLDLDHLAKESRAVLEGSSETVIEELLSLSGSSAGARPKIMAGVSNDKKSLMHGVGDLPEGYEHWIIKFTSSNDSGDNGAIEYAYSLMAKAAGIDMPETHLFSGKYFGVKRFDRAGNDRVHVHTISGLLHADHRMPSLDYESILKAALALTKSVPEAEAFFRLAAFNAFTHNRDDHAKNFSFLMTAAGAWHAAPAYDLVFSSGPGGEHSTTVMGEGKNPGRAHLQALGKKIGLKKADDIVDAVAEAVLRWKAFADEAGVTKQSRDLIAEAHKS